MSTHLTDQEIDGYRDRTLAAGKLIAANTHLSYCEDCYERFARHDDARGAAYAFMQKELDEGDEVHRDLVSEQLAAYVDGELTDVDRMSLEAHLSGCSQCRLEVADLRGVKEELNRRKPAVAELSLHSAHPFPMRSNSGLIAASAAALVLMLLVAGMLWLRGQIVELRDQLSKAELANDASQQGSRVADLEAQLVELRLEIERLQKDYADALAAMRDRESQFDNLTPDRPEVIKAFPRISLNDGGGTVRLDEHGHLESPLSLQQADQRAVVAALARRGVSPSRVVRELIGNSGSLMGPPDGRFVVLSPIATGVETDRPLFRWAAMKGAASYVVTVTDSSFKTVATSPQLQQTEWRLPRSLRRGRVYSWQVRGVVDGREVVSPASDEPDARFLILGGGTAERIARARKMYSGSHLVLGVLFARAGLLDDAEAEFQSLVNANPASEAARSLLRSIKRGR